MIVGVPKEVKSDEYRVAMLPVGAEELTAAGHVVLVEEGAGLGSGILDGQYQAAGATMVADAAEIWEQADLIVKVKEPQASEWPHLQARPGRLHLLPLRRQRGADPRRHRQRDHRDRLRDDPRRQGDACPC